MNKNRFRIIFNKPRGILMAVAEHIASAGKSVRTSDASASVHAGQANNTTVTLKPAHFAVLCHLGLVSFVSFSGFANIAHADIIADPTAPTNQRPAVINAPNGVPLINIQTPSAAGVSRNTYSQFDVITNGAILNNSRNNVQTQLGGFVQGNPNLSASTARIILNEVNSQNPSLLNGYVEVAGNRAQVVIANPAGISCNGCGFINASRATLTTGSPIMNSGDLVGFRVTGGSINFLGSGLDASQANYTDIIARAVNVNAGLWASNLNIITGSNQVNINTNGDAGSITPVAGSASVPSFAIDVAVLGGMYAGKIHMIGTEAGLGVRNAGTIGAGVGEVTIDANGQLTNAGNIASTTQTNVNATTITNTGGSITAGQRLTVDATSLTGDGQLLSGGDAIVTLASNYMQTSTGALQAGGNLTLTTTGSVTNQAKLLAGNTLTLNAANIDNTATAEITGLHTVINATNVTGNGTLTNRGLIDGSDAFITADTLANIGTGRLFGDHLAIAANTLNNHAETISGNTKAAVIAARSRLDIGATTINNQDDSLIFSSGDMAIGGHVDANHHATGSATMLNNNSASIQALGDLTVAAATLINQRSHFSVARNLVGASTRYATRCEDPPDCDYISYLTYQTTDYQDFVTSTAPSASIAASGNGVFTIGDTTNQYSTLAVGGNLLLTGNHLLNQGAELYQQTDLITSSHLIHWGNRDHGTTVWGSSSSQLIGTEPAVISAGGDLTGAFTGRIDNIAIRQHSALVTTATPGVPALNTASLPNNSLFTTNPNPTSNYLIETNPRFANYRSWLSSDYMLGQLNLDPALTQKRLGDGFYEQKLIREQVNQLTGRRFLTGYATDEAQYQALMQNGITTAQAHQLTLGVALSPAQVAQLTSDIVWLVEKEVVLADGSSTKVLVPQLYAKLREGDLTNTGALLAGNHVNLNLTGDLANGGTIAGRTVVAINADNIRNIGGMLQAQDKIDLHAANDITLQGSTTDIDIRQQNTANFVKQTKVNRLAGLYVSNANGQIRLDAGNDINLNAADIQNTGNPNNSSTTLNAGNNLNLGIVQETEDTYGQNRNSWRREHNTNQVGTQIHTSGDITLTSNNDINIKTANVNSDNGKLTLNAGDDISITTGEATRKMEATRKIQKSGSFGSSKKTFKDTLDETTSIASTLSADSMTLNAGTSPVILSETKNPAIGDITPSATLRTGDLTVTGSNVVATNNTNLNATGNITIEAAQNTHDETHLKKVKQSGFTASSTSIGYGSSKLTNTNDSQQVINVGSTVGSVQGDVNINTGKTYSQTGSDVLTPKGDPSTGSTGSPTSSGGTINIAAQQVNINAATDTYAIQQTMKYKQTGITLAVTSPVISAIQTVSQMSQAANQTSDPRMQALAAGTAALAASNAADALGRVDQFGNVPTVGNTGANDMTNVREANAADQVGGINVSLSIGTSKSSSKTTQTSTTAKSSTLNAGGDVNITAIPAGGIPAVVSQQVGNNSETGAGQDSDINVTGSQIKAANDVTLKADDQINLLAAQNVDTLNSKNKGSSASIGVSFGSDGFLVTAGLSGSKGKTNGNGSTWTETQIQGGNPSTGSGQAGTVTLQSGILRPFDKLMAQDGSGDLNMIGAQVTGNQVIANVGGNLNVISLQDTNQYKDKQQSIGGSISVGYGKMGGSFNYSDSKTKSNYASVNEQSGIMAGDGGFQVNVAGNTNLTGAVIASTDKAANSLDSNGKPINQFTTQTLTVSDIQNKADYKADAMGVSVGVGTQSGKPTLTGAGIGSDSGDASSVTVSGISDAKITITENTAQQSLTGNDAVTTVALLNHDVKVNENGDVVDSAGSSTAHTIAPIFDKEKVQKEIQAQVQITQAFSQQAPVALNSFASTQTAAYEKAQSAKATAERVLNDPNVTEDNKAHAENILNQANAVLNDPEQAAQYEKWKEGGDYRVASNIIIAAISGGASGAVGAITKESLAWAADVMRQNMIEDSMKFPGVCDTQGNCLTNLSGQSVGVNGDNTKLAGGRVDMDALCGKTDWCVKDIAGNLVLDSTNRVQLKEGVTLTEIQNSEYYKDLRSPMGGWQGDAGKFAFFDYAPGSIWDKLAEAYAGTHDTLNSGTWYDNQGNIKKAVEETIAGKVGNVTNYTNVVLATPFALSVLLPPEIWNAILLGLESKP